MSRLGDRKPRWLPPGPNNEAKFKDARLPLTPFQKRIQILRLKLEEIENIRANLPRDEKWPRRDAVKKFRDIRKGKSEWNQKRDQEAERHRERRRAALAEDFPFPIIRRSTVNRSDRFTRFRELPYDLRYIIWRMALCAPNFIEAQLYSDYQNNFLINHDERSDALKLVCRESREIALSLPSNLPSKHFLKLRGENDIGRNQKDLPCNNGSIRLSKGINFVPERDTIFIRPWDSPSPLYAISICLDLFLGGQNIRHLAVPYSLASSSTSRYDRSVMHQSLHGLETLTFMLGCEEKDYKAGKYVELRDAEEWFADGRSRKLDFRGELYDVADLPQYLTKRGGQNGDRLKVRFVAWKKVT